MIDEKEKLKIIEDLIAKDLETYVIFEAGLLKFNEFTSLIYAGKDISSFLMQNPTFKIFQNNFSWAKYLMIEDIMLLACAIDCGLICGDLFDIYLTEINSLKGVKND